MSEDEIKRNDEINLARKKSQIREALSPLNKYFASQTLGREPTDNEAMMHYIENGGATGFAQRVATHDGEISCLPQ